MLIWLFCGSRANSILELFCKNALSIFCVVVAVNRGSTAMRERTKLTTHQIIA